MSIVDLTGGLESWARVPAGPKRHEAFLRSQRACLPWSSAAWSMGGRRLGSTLDEDLQPIVDASHEGLEQCVRSGVALRCADEARRSFAAMTGLDPAPVILLIGCFGTNAFQVMDRGVASAVLCVEHLAPAAHGLGLSERLASRWVVHELAHAARYTLRPSARYEGPAEGFRAWLDAQSPAERLVDEGLASALQCHDADPREHAAMLGIDDATHDEILSLADRLLESVLSGAEDLSDHPMLYACTREAGDPPSRWGYVVGAEIARLALRERPDWRGLLASDAATILRLARRGADASWRPVLDALCD